MPERNELAVEIVARRIAGKRKHRAQSAHSEQWLKYGSRSGPSRGVGDTIPRRREVGSETIVHPADVDSGASYELRGALDLKHRTGPIPCEETRRHRPKLDTYAVALENVAGDEGVRGMLVG